jgi:DNA invertase Pin-like site-specific DNA recombinase
MVESAALYARISSDPDGTHLGVDRQVEDCQALAGSLGWLVAEVFIDNDVSAYSGRRRPEYERLCEDIKAGAVDALLVWHPDRLHRSPRELEDFIDLCENAGLTHIRTVRAGDVDLTTPHGRMVARLGGVIARGESDKAADRLRRKHAELASKGKVSGGGTRPYGYTQDRLHVVAEEAPVIREAARRVLAGEPLRSVCADLNERGITTSTGGAWSIQTVRRILAGARISGRREHRGEITAKAEWPRIITPAQSDRLRTRLRRGAAGAAPSGRSPRRYLLSGGLLRCGRCGEALVSRPRADGQRRYVCASGPGFSGCGKLALLADPVEGFVAEAVLYRLDTPALARALTKARKSNTEHDQLAVSIAEDEAMLEELARDYADRQISHAEWSAARQPIQARIDATKRRLSRISRSHRIDEFVGHSQVLRDAWAGLDLDRQRAIVATVVDHLVVSPATQGRNRFDPSRLQVSWRL